MSEKQFFSIGKIVFNKNHVAAIGEEFDEADGKEQIAVAVVRLSRPSDTIRVKLPEGVRMADVISAEDLN